MSQPAFLQRAADIARKSPSSEGWAAIVDLLEEIAVDQLESLDAALEGWPDELRTATEGGSEDWYFEWSDPETRLLRRVHRGMEDDELFEFLESPFIDRITQLSLCRPMCWGFTGPEAAVALARCPRLRQLRHLSLEECKIGDVGVTAIAESVYLRGLTHLDLSGNNAKDRINDASVVRLIESDNARGLVSLRLSADRLGPETARAIARARHLTNLETLDLGYTDLGDEGAIALASLHLPALRTLHLKGCKIGPAGARALAQAPFLSQLTALTFEGNHIGEELRGLMARTRQAAVRLGETNLDPEGLRALIRDGAFRAAAELELDCNPIGAEGARLLATLPEMPQLTRLSLLGCGIGDAGIEALAGAPIMRHLTTLHIGDNGITPRGLGVLCGVSGPPALRSLDLVRNPIGDEGAALIAGAERLSALEYLGLNVTSIGVAGARKLAQSPHLGQLARLRFIGNPVGDEGIEAIVTSPRLPSLVSFESHLHSGRCGFTAKGLQAIAANPNVAAEIQAHLRWIASQLPSETTSSTHRPTGEQPP